MAVYRDWLPYTKTSGTAEFLIKKVNIDVIILHYCRSAIFFLPKEGSTLVVKQNPQQSDEGIDGGDGLDLDLGLDLGSGFDGPLGQLALQGAAVHIQLACGRRDVAIVIAQYPLDVFPFQTIHA